MRHPEVAVSDLTDRVGEALGEIHDPCCRDRGISVVDMGLVRSISVEEGTARVELLLTSGWCPFAANILEAIRERVESLEGITSASVEIVWDEAWTMDRLSEHARSQLVFLPDPDRVDRERYIAMARKREEPR